MIKKFLYASILIIIFWIIWIGFFKRYNTYINFTDYNGFEKPYDITIEIDNKKIVNDVIDKKRYDYFGKIHPTRVSIGRHKIKVKSQMLGIIDSSYFFSIYYSKFYIEIIKNNSESKTYISIDKRFGRKFILE